MSKKTATQRDVENAIILYLSFGSLRFMQLFNLLNGKAVLQDLPNLNWLPDGTTKPTLSKALNSLITSGDIRKRRGAWLEVPEYDMPLELMLNAETGELAGLGSKTMAALSDIKAADENERADRAQRRGNNPQRLRPEIQARRIIKKVTGKWSDKTWRYELASSRSYDSP